MKFRLTQKTRLREFPFYEELTEQQLNELLKSSSYDYGRLHVSDLFDMVEGKTPEPIKAMIGEDMTVVDYVVVTYGLKKFMEFFTKQLERYSVRPTSDEAAAMNGVTPPTYQESVLFMLRKYFGLKSFAAAERLTLTDYLLAAKDYYVRMTSERNLGEIYKRKTKARKR